MGAGIICKLGPSCSEDILPTLDICSLYANMLKKFVLLICGNQNCRFVYYLNGKSSLFFAAFFSFTTLTLFKTKKVATFVHVLFKLGQNLFWTRNTGRQSHKCPPNLRPKHQEASFIEESS